MAINFDYDFSGWATKANVKCFDGLTIAPNAFKDCDGKVVPVVWNHDHSAPESVLGHALLQNRKEGVYAYVKLNDTSSGQTAKACVDNGDIDAILGCTNAGICAAERCYAPARAFACLPV